MAFVLSEKFINDLELYLKSITRLIDFDMYGEGIQQARQTAQELVGMISFIRKHPEMYKIDSSDKHQ